MSSWAEDLRSPDGDLGSDEGPEAEGLRGISSADAIGKQAKSFRLGDDDAVNAVDTITALRGRKDRLVTDMLKLAAEITDIDIAISLVAKVNME